MKQETGEFEGRETKKLFYQKWLPDGEFKAIIVTMHELASHSDRLTTIAEYFTEKGYAIYTFDLRGHYRNAGNAKGHIDSMDHVQKDIVLFMDVVKEQAVNKKVFLMGQSSGGLICLMYGITHPKLDGLIVASPLFDMDFLGKKVVKNILKLTTGNTAYTIDRKSLTGDLKILKSIHTDKNIIKSVSNKTIGDFSSALKWVITNSDKLFCPILYLQAGDDRFIDLKTTKKVFEKIKSEKTYKQYDGFLHELFNERGRIQVFQDIFIWLEKEVK